ncbi:hypothetical protein [Tahibacter amnicola]|uniref:Lipoprotein n=1 Tax=Tahibacter amnicola TaxID=2976241 RepID=A0ABY6BIB9_9GAMM|nr:hypothetical protein [Tahibacter amnicola]UXI68366.1 hypothetical protein N4264_01560 [Tahibacter amnicola]
MILTATFLIAAASSGATPPPAPETVLATFVSCERKKARREDFEAAIGHAGGKAMIQTHPEAGEGEYSVPRPVDVFGFPSRRLAVQEEISDAGLSAVTYLAQLDRTHVADVARIAGVDKNTVGEYRKPIEKFGTLHLTQMGEDVIVACVHD